MAEVYTGACATLTSTMQSCASRVDSLRTVCTKSYTALTQWPGSCECSYYVQDLMCFDEQALCASQAWSQVPQWFRDGVTSCYMKDASYQVRANLGTFSNPFTITSLAGVLASSTAASQPGSTASSSQPASTVAAQPSSTATQSSTSTTASTPIGSSQSRGLAGGAIAGIVIGIVAIVILALAVFFLMRRRARRQKAQIEASEQRVEELHGQGAHIYETESKGINELASPTITEVPAYEKYELESPFARHELPGNAPEQTSRSDIGRSDCAGGSSRTNAT